VNALTITLAATAMPPVSAPTNATTTQQITVTATIVTNSSGVAPTGTVVLVQAEGGRTATLGTANVVGTAADPNTGAPAGATASLSVTLGGGAGPRTITATYSGDTNYATAPTASGFTINVTVGTTGSFTVAGTPVTVTAGSTAVSTVTVTPSGGFTGNVQVTCSSTGLPPGVSCTPNPLTINVTGASPVTGQLTVAVAAPSATMTASRIANDWHAVYTALAPPSAGGARGGNAWWLLSAGNGLAAILLFFFASRGRNQLRAACGLGLLCVLTFTLGCGGGSSGGGGGGLLATHTSLTVSATKVASTANNVAFNVTVTASGATPTGQVQLFEGTAALGLPAAVSNGTVSITTGLGAVGTHSVSAHYLGDAKTLASSSGTLALTVTGTTTLPLTTTPAGSANVNLTIQ
jgi:hypothetical protein